jgi:hypothetical protein
MEVWMELISKVMPEDYTLVDTGDWHLGNCNAHLDGIKEVIKRLEEPGVYGVLKGDLLDSILPNDKRYASCAVSIPTPMQSLDLLTEMLMPVRNKIVAVMLGNHEYHLINTLNIASELARRLDAPYGGYVCKLICLDSRHKVMHKMLLTHGYGSLPTGAKDSIQRRANQESALKRRLENTGHSDCIYMSMGHTHKLMAVQPTINHEVMLIDDGKKLKQQYRTHTDQTAQYIPPEARWYGCSGSMLKTNTAPGVGAISYSEVFMYGPSEMGWLEVDVSQREMQGLRKVVT